MAPASKVSPEAANVVAEDDASASVSLEVGPITRNEALGQGLFRLTFQIPNRHPENAAHNVRVEVCLDPAVDLPGVAGLPDDERRCLILGYPIIAPGRHGVADFRMQVRRGHKLTSGPQTHVVVTTDESDDAPGDNQLTIISPKGIDVD